jgi:predicted ATPase
MSEPTVKPSVLFVGRETELQQLHQALRSVISSGKPQFVLIQGDFGVGKTALVEHFLAQVTAQKPSILIGQGKCAMETELGGLIPLSQLLASLTEKGVQRGVVIGDLWKFVKEVAPAWIDIFTVGAASAAVKTVEEGKKLLGHSAYSQENVFVQFTNALSRLAEKQPVVTFIDDLQWADASSLRLLFHLARYLQDHAVLFVCTYRPVEAMETSPNAKLFRDIHANLIRYGATELEMHKGINVTEYVAQRYPFNVFSSDFIAHVQELTGGHALFVSQLFSLWEETGVIASAPAPDGQPVWGLERDVEAYLAIPPTVSEVLKERIRLIEDELREILTFASVEGEDFTAQVIARLCQLDESDVYDSLDTLERRYLLIREQGTRELKTTVLDLYRFAHRFFREYIYSNQVRGGKRRVLHRQVGECLEVLYSDRYDIAGQLALHFHEAFEPMKSARYALMAAQFEQSRYAWTEGERWCEFGLELSNRLPDNANMKHPRLDLLEQSADGYYYSGKYSQADQRYRAALDLAQEIPADAERRANLCERLADTCWYEGKYDEIAPLLNQGIQILDDHVIPFGEIHVKLELQQGFMQAHHGDNDLAVQSLHKTLADAENLPQTLTLTHAKARGYNWLAIALGNLNRYSESSAAYQRAIEIADAVGAKSLALTSLLNLAIDYTNQGRLDESEDLISKCLEIAQLIGDLDSEADARSNRVTILLSRGKPREAIDELGQAMALLDQDSWQMSYMYADLAMAHLALSDLETAYQEAARGVAYAEETSGQNELSYALDALAQVEAARQDWESAVQHFNQAIITYQQAGDRHFTARVQRHLAEALLQQGEQQEAVELLETALATFQELGLTHEIAETQRLLEKASKT